MPMRLLLRTSVLPLLLLLGALPAPTDAQEGGVASRPPGGWSAGLLAIGRDVPYRGADSTLTVVPALQYEGERAYLRGLRFGWRLAGGERGGIDLVAQARMDGYKASDSDFFAGMATRQRSLDIGLAGRLRPGVGELDASLVTDALSRHRGQAAFVGWGYPWRRGPLLLRPELGLRWWSADLVDYYAGVRPEEALPGRPAWRGRDALIGEAALSAVLALDAHWALFGRVGIERLPSAISDSPLIDDDTAVIGLLGVTYRFR